MIKNEEFAAVVKEYLDKRKMPKSELARMSGVRRSVVSSLIHGTSISEASGEKIALAMGGDEYLEYINYEICLACGKRFAPRDSKNHTCSHECAVEINPKLMDVSKREKQKQHPPEKPSKIETEARKSGLSYGYYVALKACERTNTERK